MSPEMAVRVARATNTTAEGRLRMQLKLDLWEAEQQLPQVERFEVARA